MIKTIRTFLITSLLINSIFIPGKVYASSANFGNPWSITSPTGDLIFSGSPGSASNTISKNCTPYTLTIRTINGQSLSKVISENNSYSSQPGLIPYLQIFALNEFNVKILLNVNVNKNIFSHTFSICPDYRGFNEQRDGSKFFLSYFGGAGQDTSRYSVYYLLPPKPTPEPQQTSNPAPQQTSNPAPQQTSNPAPQQTSNPAPQQTSNPGPQQTANPTPEQTSNPTPQPTSTIDSYTPPMPDFSNYYEENKEIEKRIRQELINEIKITKQFTCKKYSRWNNFSNIAPPTFIEDGEMCMDYNAITTEETRVANVYPRYTIKNLIEVGSVPSAGLEGSKVSVYAIESKKKSKLIFQGKLKKESRSQLWCQIEPPTDYWGIQGCKTFYEGAYLDVKIPKKMGTFPKLKQRVKIVIENKNSIDKKKTWFISKEGMVEE